MSTDSISEEDGKMRASHGGLDPKERYEELELRESLNIGLKYAAACKELAFILRNAYSKAPKVLQSLMFQDTISAFRLLPKMSTQAAISSANVLLQNAEFALPKQKKGLAVAGFKQSMVTSKRQSKSQQEEEGPLEFPEDILIHVLGYLDLQSLVSAAMVSRSWGRAANDDCLWESLYVKFFGISDTCANANGHSSSGMLECKEDFDSGRMMGSGRNTCGGDKFKSMYERLSSKKVAPHRGYCRQCDSIVWLSDARCYPTHSGRKCKNPKIIPITMHRIVDYVLYDSLPSESSSDIESDSDSDCDSDDPSGFKLWAYSR